MNDELARRIRRVDNAAVTNDFGYNVRSELATASMPALSGVEGGTNAYGYGYDPTRFRSFGTTAWHVGNRTTATNTCPVGGGAEAFACAANALNQYTNTSHQPLAISHPTYDLDGNMLFLPSTSGGGAGCEGWFHQMQGAGTIGGILSANLGVTTVFYAYDANGNVTDLVDENGSNVAHYVYDPFGNISFQTGPESASNPFRFSSKYEDEETGLVYFGFRYMHGEARRWISRDPMEERGGVNLYAALRNCGDNAVDAVGLYDPDDPRNRSPLSLQNRDTSLPADNAWMMLAYAWMGETRIRLTGEALDEVARSARSEIYKKEVQPLLPKSGCIAPPPIILEFREKLYHLGPRVSEQALFGQIDTTNYRLTNPFWTVGKVLLSCRGIVTVKTHWDGCVCRYSAHFVYECSLSDWFDFVPQEGQPLLYNAAATPWEYWFNTVGDASRPGVTASWYEDSLISVVANLSGTGDARFVGFR